MYRVKILLFYEHLEGLHTVTGLLFLVFWSPFNTLQPHILAKQPASAAHSVDHGLPPPKNTEGCVPYLTPAVRLVHR